jgi:hypothetical protein
MCCGKTIGTRYDDFTHEEFAMFDFARKVGARGLVVASIAAGAALISSPADARGGYHGGGGWHGGGWGCCSVGIGFYDPWWPGYYPGYWGAGYPYYGTPSVTVVQQPVAAPQAPVQAAPQSYYYCDNPAGYYPYVQSCSLAWRQVPVVPTAPPGQ